MFRPRAQNLLAGYQRLLATADDWFQSCQDRHPEAIHCGAGCSACCRALFDITLLDALLLRQGFDALPQAIQHQCRQAALPILKGLTDRWPNFQPPYLLNHLPDDEWTEMPEDDMTPCPLLDPEGRCRIYPYRPMICRLHGLPHIDLSGETFSELCCSLNFRHADPLKLHSLRWNFRQTYTEEFDLLQQLTGLLGGPATTEVDTFIPAALWIDWDGTDWAKVLATRSR